MSRLFLSTLGTSCYEKVYYVLEGRKSVYTPFIQEALVSVKCRDWNEADRIVVFCTGEAEKKNWRGTGSAGENCPNFRRGLEYRLQNMGLKAKIEMVPIPDGKNEDEIMEIFSTVTSKINQGAEVILDITHSFRSLPLLNMVIINYAKALKNIRVIGIYYGAFEALGPPSQVKNMPEDQRIAPVFDLTPYDRLLDWSLAVTEFVDYGLADRIGKLVSEDVSPILKEKKGRDETAQSLRKLAGNLSSFTQNIRGARCFEIEEMTGFEQEVAEVKGQRLIEPLNPLLDLISQKTKGFDARSAEDKGFEAVRWCIDHELLPQAYVILLETTITAVCRALGYNERKHEDREFVKSIMNVVGSRKDQECWRGSLRERKEEALAVIRKEGDIFEDLCRVFVKLSDPRNDFMHCGCRQNRMKYGKLREKIDLLYRDVTSAWRKFACARTS